jgi:hypothetical protein
MAHEEYLRRNLIHASSIGVRANVASALVRLRKTKRPAKWLVELLDRTLVRAEKVHPEVAKWRNCAPDSPANMPQ